MIPHTCWSETKFASIHVCVNEEFKGGGGGLQNNTIYSDRILPEVIRNFTV